MKKEKLIEELQKLPEGIDVCVCDWRKNLNDDCGEGSSVGIYPDFKVELLDKSEIKDGCTPFVVLSIENDDYDEYGCLVKD